MMINRILMICAAVAAGAAGTSFAHAQQQAYPAPPGPVYSTVPGPYAPGGYAVDERRGPGAPDFDEEDDEAPNAQGATALPPPGPVLSPNDPRYGRPIGAPVYSDRAPTGPIPSPDDPRYGRPAGPPPVIYADRPPGSAAQAYP
ncbi:MAG: L,D-transpeptidase, partial [Bradyrhizobium sp.]